MDILYIEVFNCSDKKWWKFPLESLITLYTLNTVGLDNVCQKIKIILVETKTPDSPTDSVLLDPSTYEFSVIKKGATIPSEAQTFPLPVLVSNASNIKTSVAGLSSVLRRVIQSVDDHHPLLGFRQTCLIACAEVSVWTRFCEVDVVRSVREMLKLSCPNLKTLPVDVARLEEHMAHPPRLHNIRKQRQECAKKIGVTGEVDLLHTFAEGPYITLADIMLLPCFYILLRPFSPKVLSEIIPLVYEWMIRVQDTDLAKRAENILEMLNSQIPQATILTDCDVPSVPCESLYKGDSRKDKPRCKKAFTKQDVVETALQTVNQLEHNVRPNKRPWGEDLYLHWDSLPLDARPEGGALPQCRQARKSHQLRNMARPVLKLARPGNTIVDFCSGSGHLGIALAWLLPKCHIVLLENKDRSLERARLRVKSLGLTNVELVQGNLDYFQGKFDIGVALHACGVATDLVLQCCILQSASFVVCPCCYGAVQNGHTVTYPRSQVYRNSKLSTKDYFVLGHCADQTHGEGCHKTAQGNACMAAIDVDRCLFAQEAGYQVHVTKMNPDNCSPKNHLLVGITPSFSGLILDFDDMPSMSRIPNIRRKFGVVSFSP